jgi:hypothetical protein
VPGNVDEQLAKTSWGTIVSRCLVNVRMRQPRREERRGHKLIAAGLLMLAGPVDLDEPDEWMIRVGWERLSGSTSEFGFEPS